MTVQAQSEAAGNAQQNASSGFQASLGEGFEEDALSSVHDSRKAMFAENASFVLEGCKLLADAYGENVRVYQIADVLLQQKQPSPTDQILEVDTKIVGASYWVEAVDVVRPGDNPVRDQQNAAMVKEKLMSTRQFLEQRGDESPEATKAEIDYETILESPEGLKYRMMMLQQYVDNTFTEQLVAAINAGQAHPQTGLATGYAQGTTPPPGMQGGPPGAPPPPQMLEAGPQASGGMSGMQVPNPAAAAAAGVYAGGLQQAPAQRALAAGGAMPSNGLAGGA